jgi:uncharacterized protein (DUF1778 family)
MGGAGEFEAAADHRAVEHRHHRHTAELDALENPVPAARMRDALRRRTIRKLGEVQSRAEMLACAAQHQGLDACRQAADAGIELLDHGVTQCVALRRTIQRQDADAAAPREPQ